MENINLDNKISFSTEMEYKRLLSEYEQLSDVAKEAIILYKSALFLFMSKIMNISGYNRLSGEEIINQLNDNDLSELVTLHDTLFQGGIGKNMCARFPMLEDIVSMHKIDPEGSLKELLNRLNPFCQVLEECFNHLTLQENITVYRGTKGLEKEGEITNNRVVSTSLYKDVAFRFADDGVVNEGNIGRIYELEVEKGTNVLVCPIGFYHGNPTKSDQFEIMFLNDNEVQLESPERMRTNISVGINSPKSLTIDYVRGRVKSYNKSYSDERNIKNSR